MSGPTPQSAMLRNSETSRWRRWRFKKRLVSAAVMIGLQALFAGPSLGQESSEAENLLQIIEGQQRRLDAQEVELARQKQALETLRVLLESLQEKERATAAAPGSGTAPELTTAGPPELAQHGFEGLDQAIKAVQQDWPGSFGVQGGDMRLKISGFAEFDLVHDSDAIQTPSAFVPAAIETRNATAEEKGYSQTNASIQPSRLVLETRTPLPGRQFVTFVGVDFLSDLTTTASQFHIRQLYGEVTNILFGGDLRFGHDWATYTNIDTVPNVLDAQVHNALFVTRHPVVRWTRNLAPGLKLQLAGEATDVHLFEGANAASRWPDGVVALIRETDSTLLQGSILARDLRASDSSGQVDSTFGWGANLTGRLHLQAIPNEDFVSFSMTYGEGIGGVINDTPPDAVFDPVTHRLEAIPTLAWFAGYQHWWNPRFYSVASYGAVTQDNLDIQGPTAYRKTQYSSLNLIWAPADRWLVGIEALYGTREDKDGANGSDFRSLFVTRFNF